jgi:hypothetical protein
MIVIKDSSNVIYPADRCTWTQTEVDAGYTITSASFYSATATVAITAPELGYIGKSGRFVKMSK